MRKLKIEVYDTENKAIFKVTAARLDATNNITVIASATNNKTSEYIRLIENIDHWYLMDGMITIYYRSGCYMEITRVNV
jgi:hypothetical protein